MINAIVTDRAVLAAQTPSDLAMYLRSQQWHLETRNGVAARWTKVVGEDEFEVAQPLDSDLRDYAARVHDVIETLAVVERRSELDILEHMSRVSTDVHVVRIFPADEAPGMIGLDDGVQAFESLRGLVTAAAYSVAAGPPTSINIDCLECECAIVPLWAQFGRFVAQVGRVRQASGPRRRRARAVRQLRRRSKRCAQVPNGISHPSRDHETPTAGYVWRVVDIGTSGTCTEQGF